MDSIVVGGKTANQDNAIGTGPHGWRPWHVLAGLVVALALGVAVIALASTLISPPAWGAEDLDKAFLQQPMEKVIEKFGTPDVSVKSPTGDRLERLDYNGKIPVRDKTDQTVVSFHGDKGVCTSITIQ